MRKLTTEEFIEKAKKVHGDKYCYDFVIYEKFNKPIKIECKKHGIFEQEPGVHLKGSNCPKCRREKSRKTIEEFLQEANKIHNNKYKYDISNYITTTTPIIIICEKHGTFYQTPAAHLSGAGCKKCYLESKSLTQEEFIKRSLSLYCNNEFDHSFVKYIKYDTNIILKCNTCNKFFERTPNTHLLKCNCPFCSNKKSDREQFINKAIKIHGDTYGYSQVKYKGHNKKIIIICKIHGPFEQTPSVHLSGCGCQKCGDKLITTKNTHNNEDFLIKALKVHKDTYDYSQVEYKGFNKKIIIICKIHGPFEQTPAYHLKGRHCPMCNISKGEYAVSIFLKKYNICFKTQKTFENCKNPKTNHKLRFDFYLQDLNICIEFDGAHHHKDVYYNNHKSDLKDTQYRDSLKNQYCKDNNIKLIRIPYWEFKNIEEILKKELNL